ncbi:DUF3658 domain-containing protein [Mesorhizobium sp. YM1C-6-2]|jgi:hypothetical protein|uniref:DUF3658 domain-containing protein n=1 Tax=Mesorhizobium sp. YM1C-6-2 TaxID=1827501 RepID=UPI0015FF5F32|nr:DUF3658 domain-containing protein [Mesorhizobium sp. YM1C-6-2]
MTDLHLLWSWSAQGSLRAALRQKRNVVRADYSPDLGPLDDGRRRGTFFRELYASVGSSVEEMGEDRLPADAFIEWDAVKRAVAEMVPARIVVWTSRSAADSVFLRMAAHFLHMFDRPLWRVQVETGDYFCSVGALPGDKLISFLPQAEEIDAETTGRYNAEFEAMAADPHMLRRANEDGTLTYHDLTFYDDTIIGYCSFEWQRVVMIVGYTMGHADPLNPPGDVVIFSRLLHLVEAGKLELDGEFTSIYEDGFRRRQVRIGPNSCWAERGPAGGGRPGERGC